MSEPDPKIAELEARLDRLVRTQIDFQTEISTIRGELSKLRGVAPPMRLPVPDPRTALPTQPASVTTPQPAPPPTDSNPPPQPPGASYPTPSDRPPAGRDTQQEVRPPSFGTRTEVPPQATPIEPESAFSKYFASYTESARSDLEKFIGENLISKIGIVVLVLGVGIGAKYAIDNGWVSPIMRMAFGYVMGFGLLGFAIRLKGKYLNFSAVLLSGGAAILYFVTYFGYASYELIGQPAAFGLMLVFTVFTVGSAYLYDRQVIAHIGLVGAYAVPFLLSNNSGNYLFLFTYMAIINAGILVISVRKDWRSLFYTSSLFTWLIFLGWFADKYVPAEHFYLALVFLGVFFTTFFATKILQVGMHPEHADRVDLIGIMVTAAIFYGFCFAVSAVAVGTYAIFFSYLAVFSLAILLTSYRFCGRALVYLAYPCTWLIFGVWFMTKYRADEHFVLAAIFASVFFSVYYGATLVYHLATDDIGLAESTGLMLSNSFLFYGAGYAILDSREGFRGAEGLFTVAHAGFHSLVAHAVSRFKPAAVDVVQILAVLIITFATIAIPVQFDGNLVTLIWSVEAAVLFWFGRSRTVPLFEYLSYPLMALAAGSLLLDWQELYRDWVTHLEVFARQPIANGDFIAGIVFVAAFAFIFVCNREESGEPPISKENVRLLGIAVAVIGIGAFYNILRIEIGNYHQLQAVSLYAAGHNGVSRPVTDLAMINLLWQLNYTMLFLTVMGAINLKKVRSEMVAIAGIVLSFLTVAVFAIAGMKLFHHLRVSYMLTIEEGQVPAMMNIGIRYASYLFAGTLIYTLFRYSRDQLLTDSAPPRQLRLGFDAIVYSTVLVAASGELLNLMGQFHIPDSTKLGLSILWGVYALVLIVIGIAGNKKHLRIAAIALLAVTLVKLFIYDVADLPTIPKTILLVSIGLLMLIVSFLYNKYKAKIFKVEPVAGSD